MNNRRPFAFIATLLVIAALPALSAGKGVPKSNLDDYGRGVIEDYSNMHAGKYLEWEWIAPGVRLMDYKIDVGAFENMSKVNDERMLDTLDDGFRKAFQRLAKKAGDKGTLSTENAVYWAERASSAKRWIPYAGDHLAQAGCGIEMVFRDADGKIVAKIRHSGREGGQPRDAAWELIDEVADFVANN